MTPINFLFWNVNRNPIQDTIANLILEHDIHVLMLAEWTHESETILSALKQRGVDYFEATQTVNSDCERIIIFTKFPPETTIRPISESDKLTIRRLVLPQLPEIILGVVHFRSQLYSPEEMELQGIQARATAIAIQEQESLFGHTRTVLVGDFNMNPFDKEMVSPDAFNAVMTQKLAERGSRTTIGKEYPFFYNPMWSYFGDRSSGPPGTYFYKNSGYYWHMFDQVLIRPTLSSALTDLEILQSDGDNSFLTASGVPKDSISDHLPLKFSLAVEEQHV